ncbi:SAPS-domain-containing protein [Terfezia boudieri ATCC MYA-4762]|uniref:SAPS-domain-containing protein n=1 Tax=Terfezia boudieri ATCC MYA-4762 TaxID=1051890 RepID=A0A3N4LPM7_9PEZI|nr:SAPS-domain-containing protein [Terfezia boudieri ATCC MYA-4762]
MFWRFGSYTNISTIETLLDKPDVTLEELLDESDLLQELKQHNTKLIEFLRDENVLRRMLEYVIDPQAIYNHDGGGGDPDEPSFGGSFGRSQVPPRETDEARRSRLSCEILSSGTWSLSEALMENMDHMRMFWSFLDRDAPLVPVQAAYFTKVNETLLDKKTDEMISFFVSLENIVPTMLKHVECPMIMDLLLKIISMEKAENGTGIVDLIPILLSFLSPEFSPTIQTSTGDFLKAIITISANASQHEQSCIGPNDLTRQLVSEPCIKSLIQDMLKGGNPLTVGVGIIIEVIRKNNSDYDPENLTGVEQPPSGRDPIYLGTLLRLFAAHVPDFMDLVMNQNERLLNADGTWAEKKRELRAAYGGVIEPLGFNRFKTCELMAELLHCSNMALLNEKGSDRYVKERDKERDRLKALREKAREGPKEIGYSQDLGGFRFIGVMGEKGPLEVQNGDDNSSEGTTEDDGFEDVGAEGLLEEIRPLKTTTKADTEDEDVDLLLEEEPAVRDNIPGSKSGENKDTFFNEPLSPSSSTRGPIEAEQRVSSLVPTVEVTGPTGDPVPSGSVVQPKPDVENVRKVLEKVDIQEQVKNKDLPPLPIQQDIGKEEIERRENRPEAQAHVSQDLGQEQVKGENAENREGAGNIHQEQEQVETEASEHAIPVSRTPPPPYVELGSSSPHLEHTTAVVPSPSETPATVNFASVERRNADLPPLPTSEAQTQCTSKPLPSEPLPEPSPFSDPAGFEADQDASILPTSPAATFREYAAFIETDYDGNPVVGDYLKMQFVEHRVVVTILDFFFRFPWNNFLHNVVYDVVQQVFNGPMERGYNRTLAIDLFVTGRITERIIEGQRVSDKTQRETRMRMGYMGHLTLIAEEVVKFTEKYFNPPDILSQVVLEKVMHPDWIDYVENVLSETRERDNAILGGFKPDQSLGPRSSAFGSMGGVQGLGGLGGLGGMGGSIGGSGVPGGLSAADLDTIDLSNGTGGVGSGGSRSFGIEDSTTSAGTSGVGLLSGFGSSSDEDEDEMGRDDEDEETGGVGGGSGMSMGIGSSSAGDSGTGTNDQVGDLLFDDDIDPEIVDEDLLAKYRPSFEDMDRF